MKPENDPNIKPVDQFVSKVLASPRYALMSEVLIRRIALQEIEKRNNPREILKAIKTKLHQVGGAYLDHPVDYNLCFEEISAAFGQGQNNFRQACQKMMCYHSSTRERLPEIQNFYKIVLTNLQPIQSIIDVACGFNPLAIPWMDLPADVEYTAIDIYKDMIQFIQQFMKLIGVHGSALVGDIIDECPQLVADVALIFKTIPCLEQVDKSAGEKLLDAIKAKHLIVSFPVHSLGGRRDKGMIKNYTKRFEDLLMDRNWPVQRYHFQTELVFIVSKPL